MEGKAEQNIQDASLVVMVGIFTCRKESEI